MSQGKSQSSVCNTSRYRNFSMELMIILATPGTATEMRERSVKKDMSFIEPHTKFREVLIRSLATMFSGIKMV